MLCVELSEKRISGLPVDADLAVCEVPLCVDVDEFVDVNAGMVWADVREDLEIRSARCVGRAINIDKRRGEMMSHKRERWILFSAAQRGSYISRSGGGGSRKFEDALGCKALGKPNNVPTITIDRITSKKVRNSGFLNAEGVVHSGAFLTNQVHLTGMLLNSNARHLIERGMRNDK